ncbi:hypothetical protein F4823DRAFT_541264 [Ustulina deusta]|nr:hypothetical protein F4823DRAFT_541264 [Ustulina deusta]
MTTRSWPLPEPSRERKCIVDACSSGNFAILHSVFTRNGIRRGSTPISGKSAAFGRPRIEPREIAESIVPPTHYLIQRAVAFRHLEIVHHLLFIYPSVSLHQSFRLARAVLNNPDPEILQVLCEHDRAVANLSIGDGLITFLTQACTVQLPEIVPILHVLLDNDADVNAGWGEGGGALFVAIICHQPVEIINKMLSKGARVSERIAVTAVRQGQVDNVGALFSSGCVSPIVGVEQCIEEARIRGDEEIIRIVANWAQLALHPRPVSADKRSRKKWWTFRT